MHIHKCIYVYAIALHLLYYVYHHIVLKFPSFITSCISMHASINSSWARKTNVYVNHSFPSMIL